MHGLRSGSIKAIKLIKMIRAIEQIKAIKKAKPVNGIDQKARAVHDQYIAKGS